MGETTSHQFSTHYSLQILVYVFAHVIAQTLVMPTCICILSCSVHFQSHVCKKCGSLLSPMLVRPATTGHDIPPSNGRSRWKCLMCSDGGHIEVVTVPYVFRYLVAELAAMNIRMKIETS